MRTRSYLVLAWFAVVAAATLAGCGSHLSPSNPLLVPPPTPTPTPCTPTAAIRINCGDTSPYTDSCGNVWAADQAYSPGSWGYLGSPNIGGPGVAAIAGTVEDPLFYKETYAATLSYNVDVPSGTYAVTLWFSEGYTPNCSSGKRVFDVAMEGTTYVSNLDLFNVAGCRTAYAVTQMVPVSDGTLNIVLTKSADNAEINAIEVK